MQIRKLGKGTLEVSGVGLGCMGMSFGYGPGNGDQQDRSEDSMKKRRLGDLEVSAVGYGCMGLSYWGGLTTDRTEAVARLDPAAMQMAGR
ncbi:MAG: hypothetical protein C0504_10770 [Candidatus Solibacter sp.]|nr:hypothetical protein [Candidatus Solibacter sp.]